MLSIMHISLQWGMLVQMGLALSMLRSLIGLQLGMLVSDGSPIRHFGLQWVFDQACRSLISLLCVR